MAALEFKSIHEPVLPISGTVDLAPFLIMIVLLAAGGILMGYRPHRQRLRRVVQGLAFLAFVIGLHPCACMIRDFVQGAAKINYDNLTAFLFLSLIIPVVAFTLVWGRIFCGWVCPIGFVQEMGTRLTDWMRRSPNATLMKRVRFGLAAALLLGTVGTWAFIRPNNFPVIQGLTAGYLIVLSILVMLSVADRRWEVFLRRVRYVSLALFFVATAVGVYMQAAFCVLFVNIFDRATVMLFIGVLFASLILSQAWCRFLCPEGALLGLLTRLSGRKITLDVARCSGCNLCNQVCPVEAIEVGQVDERSCLYCCKCVDVCPTDAIDMTAPPAERDSLMALPVVGRSAT
jgi:polyferredoxin